MNDKEKLPVLRGEILFYLGKLYPDGITLTSILKVYHERYRWEIIEKALAYLGESGLISSQPQPTGVPGRSTWFYKIRPEGIRVEEGHVADPAIVLFKEEL